MPFLYRISSGGTLSIPRLRRALQFVVMKHDSLRTSLVFDTEKGMLIQQILESCDGNNQLFTFLESSFETEEELDNIMYDERNCPTHFDLSRGLVFRCHAVHQTQFVSNDVLHKDDALIFNFHHALFDIPSMKIFLHSLNKAYMMEQLMIDNPNCLRYIDYSVAEREMPMIAASTFWLQALHDYDIDRPIPLPFARHPAADEHRTGHRISVSLNFDDDLSRAVLAYASNTSTELQYLYLASYYVFLFKITNGERDLCIAMNTHGRYKDELKSIIGTFANIIPLRYRIDPHSSFAVLVEGVLLMATRSFEYSYFPLQRILDQHSTDSKPAFLNTSFTFDSHADQHNYDQMKLGDISLQSMPSSNKIALDKIMNTSNFSLTVEHDPITNQMSLIIHTSSDLFDAATVDKFAQRFLLMFKQLFGTNVDRPIYELSVILPDEMALIRSLNNTEVDCPPFGCVHHEFGRRASEHPQKMAIILDEQSLTYEELLFYVQHVASYLGQRQHQIICQCVERSIEMIIGQMAILFSGAAYCALSPEDPPERLATLVKQTGTQLVLIHPSTNSKFGKDISSCLYDLILILSNNDGSQERSVDTDSILPTTHLHDLA